jgi:drug/metabolite transporter (DMT)-like permease
MRGGERPRLAFWLCSMAGAATVAGYALSHSAGGSFAGNVLMVGAILLCGLGYAEGATLARRLGGWQVISWALLLALPFMAIVALASAPATWRTISMPAWISLAYVSIFSMLIGFVFWYRGLALGGIASVGQLQLLQPFLGLILAAVLLDEPIAWTMIACTVVVVACVAGARRFS